MKNLARRKLLEKQYPYNILYTIEKMSRTRYIMPKELTSDIYQGIEYAISKLSQRDKYIIRCRYVERKSFDEIGNIYGITGNRVSQIDRKIMGKLSSPPLVGYLIYGREEFENRLHMCNFIDIKTLPEKVINTPITELWVSMNIKRSLFRKGCKTVKDFIKKSQIWEIDSDNYDEVIGCIKTLVALYFSNDYLQKHRVYRVNVSND